MRQKIFSKHFAGFYWFIAIKYSVVIGLLVVDDQLSGDFFIPNRFYRVACTVKYVEIETFVSNSVFLLGKTFASNIQNNNKQ